MIKQLIRSEIKDYIMAVTPKKPDNQDNGGAQANRTSPRLRGTN
jgi:hypothetical protein